MLKDSLANPCGDLVNSLTQLLRHSLTLERFDSVRICRGRHDNECHDGRFRSHLLQSMIESFQNQHTLSSKLDLPRPASTSQPVGETLTSKRLDKHVHTLITELVTTSSKQINRIFQIKVVMTVKVTSDEIVNFFFRLNMEVLKLVHGREFDHVETVRQDTILNR